MIIDYNKFPFSPKKLNRIRATSPVAKKFLDLNGNKVNGEYLELIQTKFELGQEFHPTGRVKVSTAGLSGKKVVWVDLETCENIWIPLHTLLGIDSMVGYFTRGEFISECIERRVGKVQTLYHPQLVDKFDFSSVYQAHKKSLVEFIADVDVNGLFKGHILRYLGSVIRPYEALQNSSDNSVEKYYIGMKRVEVQHLWEVKISSEELIQRKQTELSEKLKRDKEEAGERLRKQQKEEDLRQRRALEERIKRDEAIRQEKIQYNERNVHLRDNNLFFNVEDNSYVVGVMPLQTVKEFVDSCFPEITTKEIVRRAIARDGQPLKHLLAMWEKNGKEDQEAYLDLLNNIKAFFQLKFVPDDETFRLFRMFAKQLPLNPYRTEWPIYDEATNLAATVDFVDFSNGKFIVYDWKRSDKLVENGMPVTKSKYGRKALHPIEHLEDCPYNRCALQMSLYKYILEKNYGMEISELRLGVFHPAYNKPHVLKVPYLKNEIETLMSLRESIIL